MKIHMEKSTFLKSRIKAISHIPMATPTVAAFWAI